MKEHKRILFPDHQSKLGHRGGTVKQERRGRSEVECWALAGTSTAKLKSTMDTLVFLCQHTCTMVLPRWGAGLSSEVRDAVTSSSHSASAEETSGRSGKVRRSLLRDTEWGDEGRRALRHRQCQMIDKSNIVVCVCGISVRRVSTQNVFSDSLCVSTVYF